MNKKLFYDLMRFAASKKDGKEKIRYIYLGVIYYFFLRETFSGSGKAAGASSDSSAGDDIYPLF